MMSAIFVGVALFYPGSPPAALNVGVAKRWEIKTDPKAYAPQFGRYCSYAVSHGYTADGDPEQWKIVDGKLYLNYNQKAMQAWENEQEKFIKDGEKNWIEFQTKKSEHKG